MHKNTCEVLHEFYIKNRYYFLKNIRYYVY